MAVKIKLAQGMQPHVFLGFARNRLGIDFQPSATPLGTAARRVALDRQANRIYAESEGLYGWDGVADWTDFDNKAGRDPASFSQRNPHVGHDLT